MELRKEGEKASADFVVNYRVTNGGSAERGLKEMIIAAGNYKNNAASEVMRAPAYNIDINREARSTFLSNGCDVRAGFEEKT